MPDRGSAKGRCSKGDELIARHPFRSQLLFIFIKIRLFSIKNTDIDEFTLPTNPEGSWLSQAWCA